MSVSFKIVIVEPSDIIRSGLAMMLKNLHGVRAEIAEVSQMDQLKSSIAWHKPRIIIINPAYLGYLSIEALKRENSTEGIFWVALQAGEASHLLSREYDASISIYDSTEAVRGKLLPLLGPTEPNPQRETLSAREKEVVVCVVKGMTNKQIADKLCLSTHTVITHRRNISAKLQIHSTAGLTIYAIVNKLIELNDVKDPGENF